MTLETSAQPQVNLGLGSRYRLGDEAMVGVNGFWDLRTTNYSTAYTRWGIGAEGFWKSFELRNNWYINGSADKDITINNIDYVERVVPGWDVELGYRIPSYPQLAMFVRGFNWDYTGYHSDNSGLEGSVNWQATPHANLELWVSNEIPAYPTDSDNDIEYEEGVVPGWDVELGYRLPFYPQLAMFVRGFNWDYTGYHSDNSGLEGSVNWQATPHANLELWVSNEIPAYPTDSDNDIDNQPGPYFGVRVRLTGRAVNYAKNNTKQNLITQMTQPVRRRYEVLLERVKKPSSDGSFDNTVGGS